MQLCGACRLQGGSPAATGAFLRAFAMTWQLTAVFLPLIAVLILCRLGTQ